MSWGGGLFGWTGTPLQMVGRLLFACLVIHMKIALFGTHIERHFTLRDTGKGCIDPVRKTTDPQTVPQLVEVPLEISWV